MELIKYAADILLGTLCGTNNMALVQAKKKFLTQFSTQKENSFQISNEVNYILKYLD